MTKCGVQSALVGARLSSEVPRLPGSHADSRIKLESVSVSDPWGTPSFCRRIADDVAKPDWGTSPVVHNSSQLLKPFASVSTSEPGDNM